MDKIKHVDSLDLEAVVTGVTFLVKTKVVVYKSYSLDVS